MAAAHEALNPIPQVLIRSMADFDIPAVTQLELACYPFPWSEGIFRDCVRVGYICRVAEIGDVIAGYGILSIGAGEAHILNLCVPENLRCRGIGRNLLDHLVEQARMAGTREAFLEVRPSNTAAIRLYQTAGFQQVGTRRGYYQAHGGREDAVVLKLPLVRAAAART